jgi:hypothetical protein
LKFQVLANFGMGTKIWLIKSSHLQSMSLLFQLALTGKKITEF